jgi:hypothetical protein
MTPFALLPGALEPAFSIAGAACRDRLIGSRCAEGNFNVFNQDVEARFVVRCGQPWRKS